MKYHIVRGDAWFVNCEVSLKLNEGWELYGEPFSCGAQVCQAIVLKHQ